MALVEDLVATPLPVLATEEVVEPGLVQAGRGRIRRKVAADAGELAVRAQDHRDRIPADDAPDAQLHRLVAREVGLLLRADRVDVARLGERRQADLELAGTLQELVHQEARALLAFLGDHLVEGVDPVVGLDLVDVRQLVLELVEVHVGRRVDHLAPL